ncbi:MAG: fructose transporter subunit [Solimicrobium sp.]|jgi:PTS system ascorbate-specific IIA component|nr:fructose transporter subunit [Solimicrobium sp.]
MIGILIVCHIPLGSAFLTVVRHVFGHELECLEAIDVMPTQHADEITLLAQQAISRLNTGQGVLVLTDILGATPANAGQQLDVSGQVAVLAGLSLPMLLRALTYRTVGLDVMVKMAQLGAQEGAIKLPPNSSDNLSSDSPNT